MVGIKLSRFQKVPFSHDFYPLVNWLKCWYLCTYFLSHISHTSSCISFSCIHLHNTYFSLSLQTSPFSFKFKSTNFPTLYNLHFINIYSYLSLKLLSSFSPHLQLQFSNNLIFCVLQKN
jgi:hypothetical protein